MAGGRELFDSDWTRQWAAERLLEIIGEASNAFSEDFKMSHPQVPWRHVVNLRHLVAHHYHRVGVDQIWTIAVVSVPQARELACVIPAPAGDAPHVWFADEFREACRIGPPNSAAVSPRRL